MYSNVFFLLINFINQCSKKKTQKEMLKPVIAYKKKDDHENSCR